MEIVIPQQLAQQVRDWSTGRKAIEEETDEMRWGIRIESSDADAPDLLQSIAMLLEATESITIKTRDGRKVAQVDPDTAKSILDLDLAATEEENTFQ